MYSQRRPAGMLTYDLHMENRKKRHFRKLGRVQDLLALLNLSRASVCCFKCMHFLIKVCNRQSCGLNVALLILVKSKSSHQCQFHTSQQSDSSDLDNHFPLLPTSLLLLHIIRHSSLKKSFQYSTLLAGSSKDFPSQAHQNSPVNITLPY